MLTSIRHTFAGSISGNMKNGMLHNPTQKRNTVIDRLTTGIQPYPVKSNWCSFNHEIVPRQLRPTPVPNVENSSSTLLPVKSMKIKEAIVPKIWIDAMMIADDPGLKSEPDSWKIETAYVRIAKIPANWFRNIKNIPMNIPFFAWDEAKINGRSKLIWG